MRAHCRSQLNKVDEWSHTVKSCRMHAGAQPVICDLCREPATPALITDLLCPVKWLMASCHQGNFEAYAGLFRFHCANASWSLVHRGPAGATPGASSTPFTWHHQSGNCASALFKHTNKQVATQPTAAVMVGDVGAVGADGGVGGGGGGGGGGPTQRSSSKALAYCSSA